MNGQSYLLTKNRHFHDYAKKVRKKSEEYRFELSTKSNYDGKGDETAVLELLS